MSDTLTTSHLRPRLLQLLYILAIAGYPIVAFCSLFFAVENRTFTIPFRLIILVLCVLTFLTQKYRNRNVTRVFFGAFLVFWCIYAAKLFALEFFQQAGEISAVELTMYGIGTCLVPMVAFFSYLPDLSEQSTRRFLFCFLFIGCILSIYYGISTLMTLKGDELTGQRISTDFLNPISLGNIGVSIIIIAVFSLGTGSKGVASKVVYLASICVGAFTVLASGSRGPLVSLLVVLAVFLVVVKKASLPKFVAGAGIFLLLILVGINVLSQKYEINPASRIETAIKYREDRSILERFDLITWALNEFAENPIMGGKLESQGRGLYPHNVIVETFMVTGIFGGLAFLVMYITGILRSIVLMQSRVQYSWISLLFLQYAIGAQFSGAIYTNTIMWCLLAAVVGNSYSLEHIQGEQ